MDKSLEDLPVPEIKSSLIKKSKTIIEKDKQFSFLDKLLTKKFLDVYFKKKK
jgi:hypothetical protein|tara:strand:+ start:25 stop:180 length:156 start_codon:yes stop_codon:yes gene_type:complete